MLSKWIAGVSFTLAAVLYFDNAHALMCEATTSTGEKVYKFVGTPTKSASGLVATMKKCPVTVDISFAKVELKDVVLDAESVRTIQLPRTVYVDTYEPRTVYVDTVVKREVFEDLVVKNPVNACERSAINACEPSFGGLPVCNTNNFENFCGFCLVTTKDEINDTLVTKRYINGIIYDGSKSVNEAISCPKPTLLK